MTTQSKKHRVLYAEDEPASRMLVEVILKQSGFDVVSVDNGQAALEKYDINGGYAVFLTDINMPVMDGIETIRRLRETEKAKQKKRLPIIALTAYATEENRRATQEVGCDIFLTKPINPKKLVQTIEESIIP